MTSLSPNIENIYSSVYNLITIKIIWNERTFYEKNFLSKVIILSTSFILAGALFNTSNRILAATLNTTSEIRMQDNLKNSQVEDTQFVDLQVGITMIDKDGAIHQLKLYNSVEENGRQINSYRLKVDGNNGYFAEVDYKVATYSNGQRALTVNWYNLKATPSSAPVKASIALHKFSGSNYQMEFWSTPKNAAPGVQSVNKRFVVDPNYTIQIEARTVKTYGNPNGYGTTYVPVVSVRNY